MGFRVSYRLSLIVAIPALVVGTGALIAAKTFFTTRSLVSDLTRDRFAEVTDHTVDKTRAHLARAIPVVELLDQLAKTGIVGTTDAQLETTLLPVLRAHPGFAWVSYSDQAGRFVGAGRRLEGGLHLNLSRIVDGKTILDEWEIGEDGARQLGRHETDTGYDPRTRPFYQRAQASGKRVWTDPYVFFDSGVPGISCSVPEAPRNGSPAGVFSIDFDLNGLSEFVGSIKLSPSSQVILFTPEGKLLAHPTVKVVAKRGAKATGELLTLDGSADAVARAMVEGIDLRAFATSAQQRSISFVAAKERYLGRLTSFAIEPGASQYWLVGAYAKESDFQGGVERNMLSALGLSLLALFGAVVLSMLLAGQVSRPLTELAADLDKIGRFELDDKDVDVEGSVFEEVHLIKNALVRMKGGLRSFASYVPRDLVRALVESGQEAKLGGEIRRLTIFFSDLAGFTTLSETVTPDQLVRMLGVYFEEMTQNIAANGGTVDKFIGDGIMAFWGAPRPDEAHAERALTAAIRCQQRLRARAETDEGRWLQTAPTRIGLATGDVLVGNIGTPGRMNYTVMGDIANLAARLESLGKQYGVNMLADEQAVTAAGPKIIARPVDVVAVKGRARGARVFELVGIAGEVDQQTVKMIDHCRVGLDAYLARRFDEAVTAYEAALAIAPNDPIATLMRDRARTFVQSPPPANWDGVYVAKAK